MWSPVVHRGPSYPQIPPRDGRKAVGRATWGAVTRRPERPEALKGKYFLARQVVEAGLLTRKQLRSSAWRRLFQGVYVDAEVPVTHGLRCAAAAAYLLPPDAVIAGRSAAVIHGVGLTDEGDPVEALVRRTRAAVPHDGMTVHKGELAIGETHHKRGLKITSPVRTCWDLARWLDLVEAVVLVDRMLKKRLVTPEQLTTYLRQRQEDGERGWRRFARVVALADGRAASPMESRLRVRLALAGLPRPEVQYVIRDDHGRHVARVDMAWAEKRVAVEYDGVWHVGSADQMDHDRERLNRIALAKWTVVHVTSRRLRDDFDGLVAEIRKALSSW